MAQWGRNDQAVTANSTTTKESSNGAPIGTYARVKGGKTGTATDVQSPNNHFGNTSPGSRASIDSAMYGNVTMSAFVNNQAVGVFAINAVAMSTVGGNVVISYITNAGTGYSANAAVTVTVTNGGSGAVINAHANTTTTPGKIDALNISTPGSGYITSPTIAIAAPSAITFNGNSAVSNTNKTITLTTANSFWQANDQLTYTVAAGNTSIIDANVGPKSYTLYVNFANSTTITLANTVGGSNLAILSSPASETGHSIQGVTATGYVDVNTDNPKVAHIGWVLRTEGTGGRAGRVFYETLVAMSSISANTTSSTGVTGAANTVTSNTTADQYI